MKSKWKYIAVIILLLIFTIIVAKYIFSSSKNEMDSADVVSYDIAVVEASKKANRSTLTYYDTQLEQLGRQNLPYGALCEDVAPVLYDNKVYLVAAGEQMKPSNVVLEIDLSTGKQKEYHMPSNSTISDFEIDDENMYIVHNLNNVTYIHAINRETNEDRKIELNESKESNVMDLALKDGILYAFGDNFEYDDRLPPSYIYEIDVDKFSIVNKVDVTEYGAGLSGSCFYGDDLYLSFSQLGDKIELDYICAYSLKTKKIRKIDLGVKEPLQIKEHNGYLYVVHSDMHDQQDTSSSISIYNPKTGKMKNIKFGRYIRYIDFKDNKMFLYGNNTLSIYSEKKDHEFIFEKEKNVYTEENNSCYYWVSGFFLGGDNMHFLNKE